MTNCIKILCKEYNTDKCNNCEYKRTYLQEKIKRIDERAKKNGRN